MMNKPPIWTFDQEDHIKVLQSTRRAQHSLAAVEAAASGEYLSDDRVRAEAIASSTVNLS
jgi:hypothetical protein